MRPYVSDLNLIHRTVAEQLQRPFIRRVIASFCPLPDLFPVLIMPRFGDSAERPEPFPLPSPSLVSDDTAFPDPGHRSRAAFLLVRQPQARANSPDTARRSGA